MDELKEEIFLLSDHLAALEVSSSVIDGKSNGTHASLSSIPCGQRAHHPHGPHEGDYIFG